jgi:hypothetical protein
VDVTLVIYNKIKSFGSKTLTHSNPVYLGEIGFVVVAVKGFFADCKCGLNCERIFAIGGSRSEMLVDVVHSWYDSRDAGSPS